MTISTLDAILVPVASVGDARTTCRAVREYFDADETLATFVFVIEKAGGAPDKSSVEQREEVAEDAFEAARAELPEFRVETRIVYDTDVADGIFDAADEADADAVAFVPRENGRLVRFLTGDVALSLVTENDLPVVSLPNEETSAGANEDTSAGTNERTNSRASEKADAETNEEASTGTNEEASTGTNEETNAEPNEEGG